MRARVAAGLAGEPRLRRRLAPTPLGLAPPVWVPDADFDVARHVVPVPEPVARADLPALAARLLEQRLDRARPLWRMDVAELTGPDGTAVVFRVHHCLADGTVAMRLLDRLLWGDPRPPEHRVAPGRPPTAPRLLLGGLRWRAGRVHRGRSGPSPAPRPEGVRGVLRRELPGAARRTPLAGRVGPRRRAAWFGADLTALHAAAHRAPGGATLNDAVLTVVGEGLRRWLTAREADLAGVRVKVPVSLHSAPGADAAAANRDSFLFVDLELGEADPAARLAAVAAQTREGKRHHDAEALEAFLEDLGHVSGALEHLARRWSMSPRVFALNVSNVPGPPGTLDVLGRRVEAVVPLAEVAHRHVLRVAVLSASGTLWFGLAADADAVEDLDELMRGMEDGARALAAGAPSTAAAEAAPRRPGRTLRIPAARGGRAGGAA